MYSSRTKEADTERETHRFLYKQNILELPIEKEAEVMMRSHVALPEIVQGIHVAVEGSPILKQGINGEIMEERGKC